MRDHQQLAARIMFAAILAAVTASAPAGSRAAAVSGRVTGVGGIVVTSGHPRALAAWYRDMLGIAIEPWGGAMFHPDAPGHPPYVVWSAFEPRAKEFAGSRKDFMLNFTVDDLDALCGRLGRKGVPCFERTSSTYGKFAAVIDPDGTKLELWQPPSR